MTDEEIKSINDLIEKKYRLITIIGVFGTIAALSINLNNYLITFAALAIFLLLCWEFYRTIPRPEGIPVSSLRLFEGIFFVFVMSVYFYVAQFAFIAHQEVKNAFIVLFIFTPYTNLGYIIINRSIWGELEQLSATNRSRFLILSVLVVILGAIIILELTYLTVKVLEVPTFYGNATTTKIFPTIQ